MIIDESMSQRWRNRRPYLPARGVINPTQYDVALMPAREAKAFVIQHHYSHKVPAMRLRVGLYHRGRLQGVAIFSHPMQDRVLDVLPCDRAAAVELGRFVLLDEVPANGESWFIARAFDLVRREGICGVVAFSDPTPRTDAQGRIVKPGHLGTIYRATNAVYAGRSAAGTLRLLPDGTVFSPRVISKIRKFDRNWQSAARDLERFGAAPLTLKDDPIAWLATWMPLLTRPMRHPGNLRYLFGLEPATKKRLPKSLPYPVIEHATLGRGPVQLQLVAA